MTKYIVATVNEIPPGERKVLEVGGRPIGVFNLEGEFFALRNQCPHQGGPLCQGRLSGLIQSNKPGEYQYSRVNEIIRCPWHGWEYDIRTGQSWVDPATTRVRRYEVSLEEGANIPVNSANRNDAESRERQKGPYIAETYEVSIEEQYVVVNI
ncbi:Rieske (2Fe-2S) protein [Chloroflexi bacterium TSY]|nr:Rieske (2Fe-2S) protein [Chloroflexi bacterium TSY]